MKIKETFPEKRMKVLNKVTSNPEYFSLIKEKYRKDREITEIAIKGDSMNILHIHKIYRTDVEIAKLALQNKGKLYEFLPEILKANPEIILEALKFDCPIECLRMDLLE